MVSFIPNGRAGNFFFCMMTAIAYAKKNNIQFSAPSTTNSQKHNPIYFPYLINPKWQVGLEEIVLNEKILYKYDELPFKEEWRNKQIVLRGYFQSEKYFKDYRKEIIEIFDFNTSIAKNTVSVHVRRTDYLTLPDKHPVVTKEWYENAMKQFPNYEFMFFSDDIEWCQREFGGRKDCSFSVRKSELDDLKLMIGCEHFINSASTFSWMGSWLSTNENKRIIVPKQWLMPQSSNEWTEEIVPKTWIRI